MIVADMKTLALAIGVGALLSLSFTAPSAMTSNVAVALVRVPQGGIQPDATLDRPELSSIPATACQGSLEMSPFQLTYSSRPCRISE